MDKNSLKNIKTLAWFNFFEDFRPYVPIAILYFQDITGSFASGMLIFSIATISSSIFEVPTGILSDYIGRKKTITIGSIVSTVSLITYAAADSFLGLTLGSIFAGLAYSFFSGNNNALLYDTLLENKKEEEYSDKLGKVSSMFQLGLGASALLGGILSLISLKFVMWISIIPQIITIILSFLFIEPKIHDKEKSGNVFAHLKDALRKFKDNWRLRTLSISSIISNGIGEAMFAFEPAFFAMVIPVWLIGFVRTLNHIIATCAFYFSGKVIKKFSAIKTLLVSETSGIGIYSIAILIQSFISPFVMIITSINFGLSTVAEDTLLQKEFTNRQRATMSSLNTLCGSLAFAVFAFIFGGMADIYGPVTTLLVGTILSSVTIPLYWKVFKKSKGTMVK